MGDAQNVNQGPHFKAWRPLAAGKTVQQTGQTVIEQRFMRTRQRDEAAAQ
jgi:hypothetical protein